LPAASLRKDHSENGRGSPSGAGRASRAARGARGRVSEKVIDFVDIVVSFAMEDVFDTVLSFTTVVNFVDIVVSLALVIYFVDIVVS